MLIRIACGSCFLQKWFEHGNKRCSLCRKTTLLRWHRQGFKLYWKYKSRAAPPKPKISPETVAFIKEMARDNRLWGAERIRGELLKLGLRVCKRTIRKYMRRVRTAGPRGQNWKTFLRTHAQQIWTCDFLPVTDLLFRSLYAFFIIELHSRRVRFSREAMRGGRALFVLIQVWHSVEYIPYFPTPVLAT